MTRIEPAQPLTGREQHVVELLAQGLSFSAIGDRLGISTGTVAGHVQRAAIKIPGSLPARTRLICWWRGADLSVLAP